MTLEFLGPLTVALASGLIATPTGMRRRVILACAVLAAAGVVLLARPQPTTDYLGIGLGLFAATCWASYILLNRTVGERLTGIEGTAAGGAVSALVYVPIGAVALIAHPPTAAALACGATAGVLASVVPFVADVLALRRVPTHFFGIFHERQPCVRRRHRCRRPRRIARHARVDRDRPDRRRERRRRPYDAARDSKWPGSSMTPTALQESSCFSTPNP